MGTSPYSTKTGRGGFPGFVQGRPATAGPGLLYGRLGEGFVTGVGFGGKT